MTVHYGRTAEELLELLNAVGSLPEEVRAREALAAIVDWSPEECVKRGLVAWVREAIKPRHGSVLVVKGVKDAFDVGLGTAKVLCDNVYSDPSHIEELSAAVHAGDELLIARILVERYFCREPDKVARGLVRTFHR
jgi:hypothetical protein